MQEFTLGSLQLLGTGITDYILQTPIEGLDAPDYRLNYYDKPGEDGGVVSSAFYGSRMVSLNGIVRGGSPQGFENARHALVAACAINKDSTGFPELTRLTFKTLAGNSYFIDAIVRRPIIAFDQVGYSKFLITAQASDPAIYGATVQSSGTIVRASGSGFIWPFIWPFTWGTSTGGSATLNNQGNMPTYPIITIRGSATNPFIYNTTLGRYMQLNYILGTNDVLVIDMKEKTITLNGVTSLLIYKTSGAEWWWLEPGNDVISYSTGSSSDTGTVEITWYNAYLGA